MFWELRLLIFILLGSADQPKPVSSRVSGKCPLSLTGQCLPHPPPPLFSLFYYVNVNVTCLFGFSCECIDNLLQCNAVDTAIALGSGIAQWLERRTRDRKVAGSNPCWSGGRIFFSRVNFLCWLLFRYPFHPRVTAVARKRPRSFCQKRRWQVTAKHAYTLRMWLCMKWHGAWLYGVRRTRRDWLSLAADSCGTSHASTVSTPLRWIFKNAL